MQNDASTSPKLAAEDVTIVYRGANNQEPVVACRNINLSVDDESFVSVVGPSGCGKTTLLYAIDGLVPIYSGHILVDGKVVKEPSTDRSVAFQSASLFPWRTVWGNVMYGLELHRKVTAETKAHAEWLIDLVDLSEFKHHYPSQLSGGMQQRANLARALAVDPAVLLLDEPFSALDAQTREKLQVDLTTIWAKTRKTMLFVTHDIAEAVFLSDQVVVLSKRPGRVVEVVNIDLPRPRSVAVKLSVELLEYVQHIWELIQTPVRAAIK